MRHRGHLPCTNEACSLKDGAANLSSYFRLPDVLHHLTDTLPSATWDQRYRENQVPSLPSRLLVECSALLPSSGRALDLACGGGRNSVYLARCGLRVVGVDRAWEGLRRGRELAAQTGVDVCWVQADLEQFHPPSDTFDLIVCFYYHDPSLYPIMRASLRPSGLLIYQTFTRDQLHFSEGPRNPAHLLEPGELLAAFIDWNFVLYHETWTSRGEVVLVARKPTH